MNTALDKVDAAHDLNRRVYHGRWSEARQLKPGLIRVPLNDETDATALYIQYHDGREARHMVYVKGGAPCDESDT